MYYLDKHGNKIDCSNHSGNDKHEHKHKHDRKQEKKCPEDCKCMKCFIKNKIGSNNYSSYNIISVILFLIIMYVIYHAILKLWM